MASQHRLPSGQGRGCCCTVCLFFPDCEFPRASAVTFFSVSTGVQVHNVCCSCNFHGCNLEGQEVGASSSERNPKETGWNTHREGRGEQEQACVQVGDH